MHGLLDALEFVESLARELVVLPGDEISHDACFLNLSTPALCRSAKAQVVNKRERHSYVLYLAIST